MSSHNNSPATPNQSLERPPLLRMLHPTSGREGFNEVNSQTLPSIQNYVDPRLAMILNSRTQQAIGTANTYYPVGFPGQDFMYYYSTPYNYGIPDAYRFFLRRY
ncbi:unnamed protein product [Rotaria magnacalcarata]|uniref:Uncharacterized protein n=1 Tax=Rotaria magnacalcarata TaxID=392030 RepID=A0A816P9Q9_9BILA|nr:unnamed protein product [Rotaria magnacalcarata]CAF2085360.1 unnamed protein product [Rotaria magnacalcarata]CAF2266834.1 unnamed protein product [Rotaria magnacalcarata]CAF3813552.1 unnamed protein product [Rotaria magnacalcarata]CAF3815663.1 unnamed protein product [Rotaria magnacalcarata]